MGGEFIPTLDEGDYVIQPVLKTGTSLGQTIDIMTLIEQLLLDNFPEVVQVVTRIGAAEVPTDPMSLEETDVIVKLKPRGAWESAKTKEELAGKMKEALSVIPGIDYEFTQPIEMRFNELITGVQSDVAIKIFGEDLQKLYELGNQVHSLIAHVQGAADITLEKTVGLPQMTVSYNRDKIAQYGLNISDLNRIVRMAFAGETAGKVFEGEKRFDLVVRLEDQFRQDIENLENLYIDLPNYQQISLKEVADVVYKSGPAKISRDNTKRRIVVGINVRNRDVESMVKEIQGIIDQNLKLPTGYTISYSGQFENLINAKDRLMIAVPISMVLIFAMLYFMFGSIRETLLVYSAIPLSTIGGIIFLSLRSLPFSISAGVGFIALFGIAVLNGIVLIDCFNELKAEGIKNLYERIVKGTQLRLRPVLLTAAAALGFFPMAFSTSAGAEVQRPLATVVIGGLVTATLLATQLKQTEDEITGQYEVLKGLLQTQYSFQIEEIPLQKLPVTNTTFSEVAIDHAGVRYYESLKEVSHAELKLERNKLLPDLHAEYFLGLSQGENARNYNGYKLGIAIPLWVAPQSGRMQAAAIEQEITENEAENYLVQLQTRFNQLSALLNKHNEAILYYENQGNALSEEIINTGEKSYQSGEIGYLNYIKALKVPGKFR